jgi:hypothetical protein
MLAGLRHGKFSACRLERAGFLRQCRGPGRTVDLDARGSAIPSLGEQRDEPLAASSGKLEVMRRVVASDRASDYRTWEDGMFGEARGTIVHQFVGVAGLRE